MWIHARCISKTAAPLTVRFVREASAETMPDLWYGAEGAGSAMNPGTDRILGKLTRDIGAAH